MTGARRLPLRRRLEVGRLVAGSLAELTIKAYGAGAAAAVLLGDAETAGGKADDAVAAVPTLVEEYRQAEYVVEHREEIGAAVDYLDENAPSQDELERAVEDGGETLRDIETTYAEMLEAKDAVDDLTPRPDEAFDHLQTAWEAKPSLDSITRLAEIAEEVGPFVEQVEILVPVYYAGLAAVNDNLASDELAATLGVVAAALGLAFVLGRAVGFWARRGRPGLVDRALQRWGARAFRGWYVRHAPDALGAPVYAAARERVRRDLLSEPEGALSPGTRRELEAYFARRPGGPS